MLLNSALHILTFEQSWVLITRILRIVAREALPVYLFKLSIARCFNHSRTKLKWLRRKLWVGALRNSGKSCFDRHWRWFSFTSWTDNRLICERIIPVVQLFCYVLISALKPFYWVKCWWLLLYWSLKLILISLIYLWESNGACERCAVCWLWRCWLLFCLCLFYYLVLNDHGGSWLYIKGQHVDFGYDVSHFLRLRVFLSFCLFFGRRVSARRAHLLTTLIRHLTALTVQFCSVFVD